MSSNSASACRSPGDVPADDSRAQHPRAQLALPEGAYTLAPYRPGTSVGESLRVGTFECRRLRARVRVLSYYWAHAKQVVVPEAQVDRYERAFLYRTWIDLWFLANGSRHAQLPENWTVRWPWQRRIRKLLARMVRTLTGR